MKMTINWDAVIDKLQVALVAFVIFVVAVSTATLILFDVAVPAGGSMDFLTNGNVVAAWGISLATTGLLMALMFTAYSLIDSKKGTPKFYGGIAVLIVSFAVYCMDIAFDSLSADVFRFNTIVSIKNIENPSVHIMFRTLIGGISTVGEALAIAIIIGMPVLKSFINNALPISRRTPQSNYTSTSNNNRYNAQSSVLNNLPRATPKPVQTARQTTEPTYHPVSYQAQKNSKEFVPENYDFGLED